MIEQPERAPRQEISGVLLIDKPVGPSSQQIVGHVKRLYNAAKVGHGGTLDPLASGLLIVGFGEATKFLQRHLDGDKRYLARAYFGAQTTTGDAEGEVIATNTSIPAAQLLRSTLMQFVGSITQTPPQFSALKVNGRSAYDYARAGEQVVLAARTITIHALSLGDFSGNEAWIEVHCSKGTYVRTLIEDIAKACGAVAHLTALRRTQSQHMLLKNAFDIDVVAQMSAQQRLDTLLSPDALLGDSARLNLLPEEALLLSRGQSLPGREDVADGIYPAYCEERFLGLVKANAGCLTVSRWLSTVSQKMK